MRVSCLLIASLLLPLLAYGRLLGDRDLVVCDTCAVDGDCANDGDPCTNEYCDTDAGCCDSRAIPDCPVCTDAGDCADDPSDPCTAAPTCESGLCNYEPTCDAPPGFCGRCDNVTGACAVVPKCSTDVECGVGDPCTTYRCDRASGCCRKFERCGCYACDPGTGDCGNIFDPPTKKVCDDNADNDCILDDCRDTDGQCIAYTVPDGQPCSDGAGVDGVCSSGACVQCAVDGDCDDGNPCTIDACNSGVCENNAVADGTGCDDGDACTSSSTCVFGVCRPGPQIPCDDGDPCTVDFCSNGACDSSPGNNGAACDDGDACTEGDTCSGGTCQSGSQKDCDDGDLCTTDTCVSGACVNDPITCGSGETCVAGACCKTKGAACSDDCSDCCSDSCKGKAGSKTCK